MKHSIADLRRVFLGLVVASMPLLLVPSAQAQDAVTLSFSSNFPGVDTMLVVKDYTEYTAPDPGNCGPWTGMVEVVVTGGYASGQSAVIDFVFVRFENPLRTLKKGDRLIVTSTGPASCNGRYVFDTIVAS